MVTRPPPIPHFPPFRAQLGTLGGLFSSIMVSTKKRSFEAEMKKQPSRGIIFIDGHDEDGEPWGEMIVPLELAPIAPDENGIIRPINGYEWGDFELLKFDWTDEEIAEFVAHFNESMRRLVFDVAYGERWKE